MPKVLSISFLNLLVRNVQFFRLRLCSKQMSMYLMFRVCVCVCVRMCARMYVVFFKKNQTLKIDHLHKSSFLYRVMIYVRSGFMFVVVIT